MPSPALTRANTIESRVKVGAGAIPADRLAAVQRVAALAEPLDGAGA